MNDEVWLPVAGFESLYSVSNMGNMRREEGQWRKTQRPLKGAVSKYGYRIVNLVNRSKKIYARVHRLVLVAFVGLDPDRPEVNHKNLNKLDNRLENLEWCTNIENVRHGFALRGNYVAKGSNHCCAKLNESQIVEIRDMEASGQYSRSDLCRRFNVGAPAIHNIVRGKSWKHVPMPAA